MFKDYISLYYLPIDIILIILLINFILYILSTYYKETHNNPIKVLFNKGLTGEYLAYRSLNRYKGYKRFIFNVHIPTSNKSTEIDIIMINNYGIHVIESKNYSGLILGNENNEYWTQVLYSGQKYKFYNPIRQNNTHINNLKHYLSNNSNYFYSYIVFSNECELKVNTNTCVVNRRDLLDNINIHKDHVLSNKDVDDIYNRLISINN